MSVTVTCHNFLPYEKDVRVQPGNLDHDVGVVSIIEPHGSIAVGTNVIPKVNIKNYGSSFESFPVTCKIGSIYEQTITSVFLASGDTTTISFPVWNAVGGYHLVKSYTGLSNDQWRNNDSAFGSVTVILANDVGVEAITSPDSAQLINISFTPKARIKNYGSLTQTNFSTTCSIVGATGILRYTNTQTISSISPNDTVQINFSSWVPNVIERCTVKVRTNLIGDEYPSNDRIIRMVTMHSTFQIQIGYATTNARTEPFDRYYNYNTHEAIYLQSEIGAAGLITQIGYYKESGSNVDPITPVTIYMKQTVDSLLPSGTYSLSEYTQVYSEVFPNNAASGWMELQITTPFEYNNRDNLAILILKGNQPYISSGYPYWRYTTTATYKTRGARSDASQPSTLTQTYNRPNIRLLVTALPGIEQNDFSFSSQPIMTVLYAPKPNPIINGLAHISFSLAEPSKVSLKIYDASGRIVKTLVNELMSSGVYYTAWNGKDDNNRAVAEGIYFYSLETPKQKFTKKMVFTR
jgi:hypothetical protein